MSRSDIAVLNSLRSIFVHTPTLVTLFAVAACHAGATTTEPPATELVSVSIPDAVRELETQYHLALGSFDRGLYDDAAAQFSALLLRVPHDPSGDHLRHLLVQHIAWSLLGSYDMSDDPTRLDAGEAVLERYLAKHEQLLPNAAAERGDIYELLGEYNLRRDGGPPPDANAQLQALVRETHRNIERPTPRTRRQNDDRMVREIDVDAVRWAKLDDPSIQRYLRDLRYTGASQFEQPGEPYNPTRVLVRGWVSKAERSSGERAGRRAYDMLRAARPALERCYEAALGRGANMLMRFELELRWDEVTLADVALASPPLFDPQTSRCVVDSLRNADIQDHTGAARAELHLTFFVQPERRPDRATTDYDYFRPALPPDSGDANRGARPEDVSINPWCRTCPVL